MDYQNLINNYQTEFTEEYKDISARKLYRNILKDLKYMFLATRNMNLQSKIKYLTLEQDLFYKKDNLEKGEYSHYILLSTGKRKPRGYGRLIELNQRKQTDMEEFYEIFYLFKIVINIYYKYYKPKTNEYLVLFAAILEMITFVWASRIGVRLIFSSFAKATSLSMLPAAARLLVMRSFNI